MVDVRDTIIEEIRTRLTTIKQVNTNARTADFFRTDIGLNVLYGGVSDPVPSQSPGVNFSDGSEDSNNQYGRNAREFIITVEAFEFDRDAEVIKKANDMLHDVESVLLYEAGTLNQTLGGVCNEIRFIKKDPFMLKGQVPLVGAVMDFLVKFCPE